MALIAIVVGASALLQTPLSALPSSRVPNLPSLRGELPPSKRSADGLEVSKLSDAFLPALVAMAPLPALADDAGFSSASYYTTLALYIFSFPGIYSLVKRSVKSKVVRRTYEVVGPAADGGRPTRELAGDIVAFFQANNYKIKEAGDVIVFEGLQASQNGKAAFLTFCTFICLGSLALVLTILEQQAFGGGLGNLWYGSTLISPLAGKYYLDNAERTDEVSVKLVTEDDESLTDVVVQGDEEEVDRFQKTLDLREKGMVYVKGIFN